MGRLQKEDGARKEKENEDCEVEVIFDDSETNKENSSDASGSSKGSSCPSRSSVSSVSSTDSLTIGDYWSDDHTPPYTHMDYDSDMDDSDDHEYNLGSELDDLSRDRFRLLKHIRFFNQRFERATRLTRNKLMKRFRAKFPAEYKDWKKEEQKQS